MADVRDFQLPDLGEGLTEAVLVNWLVEVGDRVEADQAIAEVTTEKAEVQVPTPFAGVVRTLHAQPGETVAVGRPLITVEVGAGLVYATAGPEDAPVAQPSGPEREGDAGPTEAKAKAKAEAEADAEAEAEPGPQPDSGPQPATAGGPEAAPGEVPAGRSASTAAGGDESGSGRILVGYGTATVAEPSRRRVTTADVARHLGEGGDTRLTEARTGSRAAGAEDGDGAALRRVPLTAQRRVAAERLSRAHADIPAATAWVAADASRLLELRDLVNSRQNKIRVTPLAVLLRLTVAALQRYPVLNAAYDPERGEAVLSSAVHLGVATHTELGLVVPVIRDAQRLSVAAIAAELVRLAVAAREGRIAAAELRGSTFTVSNFGGLGVDSGIALINPPEAAVLGCGRIAPRPWVDGDAVVVRPVIELSLSFDHRLCDGADAAGFLRLLGDLVESPALALAGA
jgi:pyruvate dehydrogenase E2 component (dihydrolipoamide acetyltransferase)